VISDEPRNADAYYNRGVAYAMEGKYDLSRADFRKALEIKPGYEDAQSRLDSLSGQS
jgi:lipoprotein NlpI